ncbi:MULTISPECIES: type II toxin-antitoxin system HicB family antitoxin [Klebsiella/Raoultella group]|jgi:predicted RNase H-like HicB family nuclease|uniref:Type II toxin-antitoxin system HicB family antitoxin n=8 Tax=Klebsiella pneumoniae complex TaxID=3390273 RepID=A0AAW9PBF1_KLEVA|nr:MULTISPECIES: type II toxin-antitoxin system HicB family antitoxin [Klebsiella/Raoultella group]MCQ8843147.1 type II toxin-antitoxin system HicB family antitoxin [Klebsiella sp. KJ_S1]MDU2531919.1 type II toxin-antitoxin system HicB family antitoxin [Escherichia coli]MDU6064057.1 type II toxin-antitoxin system HicB family antitoxin [Anaerococcus sp.]MDU7405926.1 type II toxin-antitoxin system HicB family antitoxin [Citrobacter portucalensis]DAI84134.1 MAG TPA: HicB-like antitoxin [Bacteriop
MIYPLFIFKADDGTFDGYFPDIEGCMFAGNNLESALRDAESAFGQHMEVLTEQGGHVPAPSDPADYLGDERLTMDNGFLALVEIDPSKYETKAVKFNLTMPGNLLTAIDSYIEKNGRYKNRSAFLSEIARKEIARG